MWTDSDNVINSPVPSASLGSLITFNIGRKMQICVTYNKAYARINQGVQNDKTWLPWVNLS